VRIAYYALRPVQVGDEVRQPGDLVPEAREWKFVDAYIREGKIAPVLVATLPRKVQEELQRWEEEQHAIAIAMSEQNAPEEDDEPAEQVQIDKDTEDGSTPSEDEQPAQEAKV
jgi:hypothetical protein